MGKKGGQDHFVEFEEHTLLKHGILDKYVKRWAQKLLNWRGASAEVWFVDGFAGEGRDQQGNPGSPVIAAQIAKDTLAQRGITPSGNAPMRVFATEKDANRFAKLAGVMEPFTSSEPPIAEVRCGTLHDYLNELMGQVGQKPALFFLDPFGVDGLIVRDLRTLLSGPHNEVFVLFSDTGAKRLHLTLRTTERNVDYEVSQVLQQGSLFAEMAVEDAEQTREQAERSNRALTSTQEAARRILGEVLGKERLPELDAIPNEQLQDHLTALWMQKLLDAGARFVYSLPIRNRSNTRAYQLVYATKSPIGLWAMKDSMQEALRASALPSEVVSSIHADLHVNIREVVADLKQRFAGKTVLWTAERNHAECVKKVLYEETPLLPGQFAEVKEALKKEGIFSRKRKEIVTFPA